MFWWKMWVPGKQPVQLTRKYKSAVNKISEKCSSAGRINERAAGIRQGDIDQREV